MSERKPYVAAGDCPDSASKHTPCPKGYLQWHDWAKEKNKTHKSTRCPTCGLWAIWVPRGGAA